MRTMSRQELLSQISKGKPAPAEQAPQMQQTSNLLVEPEPALGMGAALVPQDVGATTIQATGDELVSGLARSQAEELDDRTFGEKAVDFGEGAVNFGIDAAHAVGTTIKESPGELVGGISGAIVGSGAGPGGTVAGGAAGSVAGRKVDTMLYDWTDGIIGNDGDSIEDYAKSLAFSLGGDLAGMALKSTAGFTKNLLIRNRAGDISNEELRTMLRSASDGQLSGAQLKALGDLKELGLPAHLSFKDADEVAEFLNVQMTVGERTAGWYANAHERVLRGVNSPATSQGSLRAFLDNRDARLLNAVDGKGNFKYDDFGKNVSEYAIGLEKSFNKDLDSLAKKIDKAAGSIEMPVNMEKLNSKIVPFIDSFNAPTEVRRLVADSMKRTIGQGKVDYLAEGAEDILSVSPKDFLRFVADIRSEAKAFSKSGNTEIEGILFGNSEKMGLVSVIEEQLKSGLKESLKAAKGSGKKQIKGLINDLENFQLLSKEAAEATSVRALVQSGLNEGAKSLSTASGKTIFGSLLQSAKSYKTFTRNLDTYGSRAGINPQDFRDSFQSYIKDEIIGEGGLDKKKLDAILRVGGSPQDSFEILSDIGGEAYAKTLQAIGAVKSLEKIASKSVKPLDTGVVAALRLGTNGIVGGIMNPNWSALVWGIRQKAVNWESNAAKAMLSPRNKNTIIAMQGVDALSKDGFRIHRNFMLENAAAFGIGKTGVLSIQNLTYEDYLNRAKNAEKVAEREEQSQLRTMSRSDILKGNQDVQGSSILHSPSNPGSSDGPFSVDVQQGVRDGVQEDPEGGQDLFQLLEAEEGFRSSVYTDTTNHKTVGIGFNLDQAGARKIWSEVGIEKDFDAVRSGEEEISRDEALALKGYFNKKYEPVVRKKIPNFDQLSPNRQSVLMSMIYQLGPARFGNFKNTLGMIASGNFEGAAEALKKAKIAKQAPNRIKRAAFMLANDVTLAEAEASLVASGEISERDKVVT